MGNFSTPQQDVLLDVLNEEYPHTRPAPKEIILQEGIS